MSIPLYSLVSKKLQIAVTVLALGFSNNVLSSDEASLPVTPIAEAPELLAKLQSALTDLGPDYKPRTEHFNNNQQPTYINRLILERSPYLVQHAHNPVNWFPWGKDCLLYTSDAADE